MNFICNENETFWVIMDLHTSEGEFYEKYSQKFD